MKLAIVIPTYNEAENLPRLVSALFALPLEQLSLLIVDDHSPDGTGQLAEDLAQRYPGRISILHRSGKLGLGTAYITGFGQVLSQGQAQVIGQMDCDFSHPPEKLPEMLHALSSGVDVVIGSRYVPGGSVDERWPVWRRSLSAFGNFYARTILRLPLRDVTGGFRLYRRHVLETLPLHKVRSNGYAFQVELAYLLHRFGFTWREVPIYFADRRWGQSKMSFRIQREAALRVWQMLWEYRELGGASRHIRR